MQYRALDINHLLTIRKPLSRSPRLITKPPLSLCPGGRAHEKEVSLMRREVRFERVRQAPKILLKLRQTGNGAGSWITGL
jgi:hypothetical protein